MPDKKLTDNKDFFTFNNIDFDKAYEIVISARGGGKLFFLEQLCIKQKKEINRLQAENERLTIRLRKAEHQLDDATKMYNTIKAEAYKEFAERLKEKVIVVLDTPTKENIIGAKYLIDKVAFDNISKELVGEDNE